MKFKRIAPIILTIPMIFTACNSNAGTASDTDQPTTSFEEHYDAEAGEANDVVILGYDSTKDTFEYFVETPSGEKAANINAYDFAEYLKTLDFLSDCTVTIEDISICKNTQRLFTIKVCDANNEDVLEITYDSLSELTFNFYQAREVWGLANIDRFPFVTRGYIPDDIVRAAADAYSNNYGRVKENNDNDIDSEEYYVCADTENSYLKISANLSKMKTTGIYEDSLEEISNTVPFYYKDVEDFSEEALRQYFTDKLDNIASVGCIALGDNQRYSAGKNFYDIGMTIADTKADSDFKQAGYVSTTICTSNDEQEENAVVDKIEFCVNVLSITKDSACTEADISTRNYEKAVSVIKALCPEIVTPASIAKIEKTKGTVNIDDSEFAYEWLAGEHEDIFILSAIVTRVR